MGVQGKIFISYRRDDVPADARGICDRLSRSFGASNVFIDVDKLVAGQRFERELDTSLAQCDVLIAVIGARWMDLLADHTQQGKRDYVCEEIAAALQRNIVVVPLVAGREDSIPSLPRAADLPESIRDLVLYQKHRIAHETFRRDADDLVAAIKTVLRHKPGATRWRTIAATVAICLSIVGATLAYWYIAPSVRASQTTGSTAPDSGAASKKAAEDDAARKAGEEAQRQADAEAVRKRLEDEARQKAESDARAAADAITDCDRLAASPYDKDRPTGVAGVLDNKIDIAAGPACDDAMRHHPEIGRFAYQAGRAAFARKDFGRAAELFQEAANKGSLAADAKLGILYLRGLGVPQDSGWAHKLLDRAAVLGDSDAMAELGDLCLDRKDYDLAQHWYKKAAAQENTHGLARLGLMYANGLGVAPDPEKSLRLLERAAALGGPVAMFYLGGLYEGGSGVPKDLDQARQWYEKSFDAGYQPAMERLRNLR